MEESQEQEGRKLSLPVVTSDKTGSGVKLRLCKWRADSASGRVVRTSSQDESRVFYLPEKREINFSESASRRGGGSATAAAAAVAAAAGAGVGSHGAAAAPATAVV